MSDVQEKGYVATAIDAVSSAAASVGDAAEDLKNRISHMGNAAEEKLKEEEAAAKKELDKETVKDSSASTTDRIKAAGGVVEHTAEEALHKTKYEAEKKQATK